jgi:Subtilase family
MTSASAEEQEQIKQVLKSVRQAAAFPPDWQHKPSGAEYLYRKGCIIVRDWHVGRVREILSEIVGSDVEAVDVVAGATQLTWAVPDWVEGQSVHDVLTRVEEAVGPGVAAPDYLLYVCVHTCAAIEPEFVPEDAVPIPRVQTGQDAANPRGRHGKGVHVLLMDNGLIQSAPADHAWMAGVTGEPETASGSSAVPPDGGHGTFTAGCVRIAAPEAGVHVVNATATLPVERDQDPIGAAFESDLVRQVHAQLSPASGKPIPDILLLNFAGTSRDGGPLLAFAALYDDLIQHLKELLILSPAGNEGDDRKNWPGSFSWVVSVGGLAANYRDRASWSNYGHNVDVFAPGDRLVNAFARGRYDYRWGDAAGTSQDFEGMALWSGTSFATPLVAGLVASRMSDTGQSSRRAWASLLELAEQQAVPGVGPVLYPGQA